MTYQIAYVQHVVKLLGHLVVLQGHEERVQHNAEGDGEVSKRVHYHKLDKFLDQKPKWAAIPNEEFNSEVVPAGRTFLV